MINVEKNFKEEIINSKDICIVDFWASWCGPCKMFGPIFEKVANDKPNIKFCKFNIDKDSDNITNELGVMSIPTVIIFKNGVEVKRNIGLMNENALIEFLEDI